MTKGIAVLAFLCYSFIVVTMLITWNRKYFERRLMISPAERRTHFLVVIKGLSLNVFLYFYCKMSPILSVSHGVKLRQGDRVSESLTYGDNADNFEPYHWSIVVFAAQFLRRVFTVTKCLADVTLIKHNHRGQSANVRGELAGIACIH